MEFIDWTPIIIKGIELLLVPLLMWLIKAGADYLIEKKNNETVTKYVRLAEDAVCTAVTSVKQTYVDNIKGTSGWNEDAQKCAFALAKRTALKTISKESINIINIAMGDFEEWLDNNIQQAVQNSKD